MMVRDKFTNSDKVSNVFRPLNIILSSFCQINGNCSVSRGGCSGISKTFSLCYLYVVFRRCILLEIMLGFSFGDKISRYLQLIQRDAFLPNTVVGVLTMPPPGSGSVSRSTPNLSNVVHSAKKRVMLVSIK